MNQKTMFAAASESDGSRELQQLGAIRPNDLEYEFAYCLSSPGECFPWLDQSE
ncbi:MULTISPECIES: hypothetical protein [unclassified Mycobacterium]|uniref:hypothetical protein n=1 Tax=unclassified Mycobacterium TaxID=2642494 RepID=UPI000ABCB09B|nr:MULTISPECIES: hypothetical protein [unclassified Mycobacterium]